MSEERPRIAIPVAGMTCAACTRRVEKVLSKTAGVSEASANFATGKATVEYDPNAVGLWELVGAIRGAGYGAEVRETSFGVSGMSCASCVGRVENALKKVPGVLDVSVNLATERVRVEYLPGIAEVGDLERAVEGAGYGTVRGEEASVEDAREREHKELRGRFLATPVQFWAGWRFYAGAWGR